MNANYLIGAKQNPDGSLDTSAALSVLPNDPDERKLYSILQNFAEYLSNISDKALETDTFSRELNLNIGRIRDYKNVLVHKGISKKVSPSFNKFVEKIMQRMSELADRCEYLRTQSIVPEHEHQLNTILNYLKIDGPAVLDSLRDILLIETDSH